jgi:hypothetical protein
VTTQVIINQQVIARIMSPGQSEEETVVRTSLDMRYKETGLNPVLAIAFSMRNGLTFEEALVCSQAK